MHRNARITRTALLLLLCGLAPASARAQAQVDVAVADEAYVNEPLHVQVVVSDFETCDEPQAPVVADADVKYLGSGGESTQQTIVNGRVWSSRSRRYVFEVVPRKLGPLLIPPIAIVVDGKRLATRPQNLTVRASDAEALARAEITCDRTRVYVGQRVHLVMTLRIRAANAGGEMLDGAAMFRFVDSGGFGPFPLPTEYDTRSVVGGDGRRYPEYAYHVQTDYIPSRIGPLEVDVAFDVKYPTRFRSGFFEPQAVAARRLRIVPRMPPTEVLPLPMEGRPRSFAGAIGRYKIDVHAQPTELRVGDPIQLTIDLSGDGPVETLSPPLLASDPALNERFRIPSDVPAGENRGSFKRFTQVLRAKSADVTEIPALEYPYFDPEAATYQIARSAPIPIRVIATETLDEQDLGGMPAPAPPPGTPAETLDGLWGNETDQTALLATWLEIEPWQVAAATVAPAGLFAIVWFPAALVRRARSDQGGRRRAGACRNARRRIADAANRPTAAERAREIGTALATYLADRLGEPAAKVYGADGARVLAQRGAPPDALKRWTDLVAACEQLSFGGGSTADVDRLAAAAQECLAQVEHLRL
ncbi:MAG: hypothetical protein CHACPFDD_01484 [Phycisphaerae bacterium]|nr:hypothetical protein [Phycisphaerae bacterium]